MSYWKYIDQVEGYSPPGHSGTVNRRIIGREDGIQRVEMIFGEMDVGGEAEEHFHDDLEQLMFILEGKMYVEIEGEKAELTKGCAISIPPKVTHFVKNSGKSKLRFILIYSPPK
ncbi:cupin domain-containing protein [Rossellomorea sp. BNER]|uniref:cupin domain-containing protein n=1 Tax=Rossellomorea sp. BNER TaxID=2962031 RepID=UPI003AF2F71C|nr:cupin domain-containing protein [Rossellomorea sp. BNER]